MAEISSALEATILAVIDATEIRYGMKLIRLVDGEHTYRLEIDGEPPILFTDNADGEATDQLYAYVAQRKREERSKAVQAIIAAPELQSLRSQAGVREAVAWRPSYEQIIDVVEDCRSRRDKAGESSRMMSKWISEGLNALYARPAPIEITEENVRSELEKMHAAGCLTTYEMADDRGLTVDEYVDLFMGIYATLSKAKSQQEGETE